MTRSTPSRNTDGVDDLGLPGLDTGVNVGAAAAERAARKDLPVLSVRGLSVEFPTDDGLVHAVDDMSFDVYPSETLGIVGESGSGKSVTSMAILGLLPKTARITGEVQRAGAYPLLPGMTMLQALSSAGGFTQFANLKKIYMLRTEGGKQVRYPFNYKEVIAGKDPEQNIVMKAGDTIVVP